MKTKHIVDIMTLLKQTLTVDQVRDCSLWLLVEGGGGSQEI